MFINRAEVSRLDQVAADSATAVTPVWGVLAGLAFAPGRDAMAAVTSLPSAGVPFAGAMCYTNDGRLYVWPIETLGVPPVVFFNQGLPFVPDGRMVVSSDPRSYGVAGWPITAAGWVCMNFSGISDLPGAFDFFLGPIGGPENPNLVGVAWFESTDAATYEIYRDAVLVHTEPAGVVFEWVDSLPAPGTYSYTMIAVNGSGSTPSSANPQSWVYP